MNDNVRIVAVDWSGALRSPQKKIWLAHINDGGVEEFRSGRNREAICNYLTALAATDSSLIVGLDFAFSFPSWFVKESGAATIEQFWTTVEVQGERWLRECTPPFWGRKGTKCEQSRPLFRLTESKIESVRGVRPKSVFQIAGAGAVGTGSIRGIPVLRQLRAEGFTVWPFDQPKLPLVLEIYPRTLTGDLRKTDPLQRKNYLREHFGELDAKTAEVTSSCEDALDAMVSALIMSRNLRQLQSLQQAIDPQILLEGWIWSPRQNIELTAEWTRPA